MKRPHLCQCEDWELTLLGELAVKLQSGVQTDINYAYDLDFFSGYVNPNSIRQRSYGYCVRLVTESK